MSFIASEPLSIAPPTSSAAPPTTSPMTTTMSANATRQPRRAVERRATRPEDWPAAERAAAA